MARARLHRLIAWPPLSIVRPKSTKPGRAQRAEMPMIDVAATDEIADDARARSNLVRLAAAQALTGANSAVIFGSGQAELAGKTMKLRVPGQSVSVFLLK